MQSKQAKEPGPDHPIEIAREPGRLLVTAGGRTIADSSAVLTLREATYPPVHYFPRADVDMGELARSDHATYCPYKGDCSYFSVPAGGARGTNAAWSYEAPYPAVAPIKDHIAFYPDRIDSIAPAKTEP